MEVALLMLLTLLELLMLIKLYATKMLHNSFAPAGNTSNWYHNVQIHYYISSNAW